jgi:dsDNA-binding SOS-regulon protein
MKKLNPELEPGDEIVLIDMDDPFSSITPGTKGIVIRKVNVMGDVQYSVNWENGSKLELLDGVDKWILASDFDKKSLKEQSQSEEEMNFFLRNADKFKNYDIRFLRNYLMKLRESGITNMFGAARFLYMGEERIAHEFKYSDISEDNEAYDELLEMADKAQSIMVSGAIKTLEQQNKELDVSTINSELSRASKDILNIFIRLF